MSSFSTAAAHDRPLDGVLVADFGQYIAAPGAAAVLGELGADVIKVETVRGDQARHIGEYGHAMLRAYSAGKRSIALDLRTVEGLDVARRLVQKADVLIQNMRPGAMERLGLGPEECLRLNQRLVYGSITGFGSGGPSATRPGLDIAAQAESGIMSVTGEAGRDPMRVGFPVVDAATAEVLAQGVLAALLRTMRTGRGAVVETSLLEVALRLQVVNWEEYFATGLAPSRRGNGQASIAPAADVITTSDGHIVLSAYTVEHWAKLCRLLDREDLIEDERFADNRARLQNRGELHDVLSSAVGGRSTEELVAWLSSNGIIAGAVRSYEQVLEAGDVVAQELFRADATGAPRQLSAPYTIDGSKRRDSPLPPHVGQHTRQVLGELGFSPDQIGALVDAAVVYAATTPDAPGVSGAIL